VKQTTLIMSIHYNSLTKILIIKDPSYSKKKSIERKKHSILYYGAQNMFCWLVMLG